MKVIISGGGTGGHIYPALTIAEQIARLRRDAEILFVGTQHGMEKEIVPRYGFNIAYIDVAGFKRSLSLDTFTSLYKLFTGLAGAWKLLSDFKPDLVVGTGGYVCGPVVFLAALKGIPTCVQEQNAIPGITNKILSRFVRCIFLGYNEAGKYFPGHSHKVFTGNPIRADIMKTKREDALASYHLDPQKKTILVAGGSLGAVSINTAMLEVERALSDRDDVQVLHSTGEKNYDAYIKSLEEKGGVKENIIIKPYLHDMPLALAAADLAIFRSGAIGLAELTARGVPSILIPFPYATANHQEFNARALEAVGAAKVILDKDLNSEALLEIIENLLIKQDELKAMQEAARKAGRPGAAQDIASRALNLVRSLK